MESIHGYALRIAMLVLVSAFAFGAIAAVAIVRLQDPGPADTAPEVADFVAEPVTQTPASQIAATEPTAQPPVAEQPATEVAAVETPPEPPVVRIAAEPLAEELVQEPAPQTPPSPVHEDVIRQSFVSFTPEPPPQGPVIRPEPPLPEPDAPQWLEMAGMTPTLEGLQTEIAEVALADPPENRPDTPPADPEPLPEPEPVVEPEIPATPDENCDTASADWAMFLFNNTALGDWGRVPNVRVVSMGFCADTRQALEGRMQSGGRLGAVRGAAAGDQLVSLALQRAAHGPEDVFAIATEGSVLNVYVY